MAQTIIERQITDLSKEEFCFNFLNGNLILDSYTIYEKATLKSKYKPTNFYSKINERDSTIKDGEVPLTAEIRKQAFEKFISTIQVLTSTEQKNDN